MWFDLCNLHVNNRSPNFFHYKPDNYRLPMWYWKSIQLWNWFSRPWKRLNQAKMSIKYWKSMGIPNSAICLFKFCTLLLVTVLQMFFALCSMNKILKKWR